MRRPLRHLFAAGLAAAAVAIGTAGTAQAMPATRGAGPAAAPPATVDSALLAWQDGTSLPPSSNGPIWDFQTGLCLDTDYWGNVYTDPCGVSNSQNWIVTGSPNALGNQIANAQIVNAATGWCLGSDQNGYVNTQPCSNFWYTIAPWLRSGTINWNIADIVGVPTVVNTQTGQCLDSNYNGNVYTLPCNGGNYQYWPGPD